MTSEFQPTVDDGFLATHRMATGPKGKASDWLAAVLPAAVLRRIDPARALKRADGGLALHNEASFVLHGDEMLAACRRQQQQLAVAVFDCGDLLEAHTIYGSRTSRKLLVLVVRKLLDLAGKRGLVARTGAAQFTVVLPGFEHDKALNAIHQVLGSPARIEVEAGDSEIVLVPDYLVATALADTVSVAQLHEALCRELRQTREQEHHHRRYLRYERESHSSPQGLLPSLDSGPPDDYPVPAPFEATVPMPIPAR